LSAGKSDQYRKVGLVMWRSKVGSPEGVRKDV
jgi:hypothetical protein